MQSLPEVASSNSRSIPIPINSSGRAVPAPAFARQRRVKGVTSTRLTDLGRGCPSIRYHILVANFAGMPPHRQHLPWRPGLSKTGRLLVRQHRAGFLRRSFYFFKSEPCDRMHCHLPSGIFNQVSAQRALMSIALLFGSVPFALNTMVATAVCPNTVILRS